jgi:hypothetical protein
MTTALNVPAFDRVVAGPFLNVEDVVLDVAEPDLDSAALLRDATASNGNAPRFPRNVPPVPSSVPVEHWNLEEESRALLAGRWNIEDGYPTVLVKSQCVPVERCELADDTHDVLGERSNPPERLHEVPARRWNVPQKRWSISVRSLLPELDQRSEVLALIEVRGRGPGMVPGTGPSLSGQ